MKKKIYIFIISIISVIIITTAFMPYQSHNIESQEYNKENKILNQHGPESGYIEKIGE